MKSLFTEDMSMDEIMRAWPRTIRVVLRHRMLCVGCPIAPFHTISDGCREHGVDESLFLDEIKREIGSKNDPS
jgi:hybrid cluster-associated redox disulfide protein